MHTKSTTCTQYIRIKHEYQKVEARLTSKLGGSIINEQHNGDMIYKYIDKSTCLTSHHTCKHAYNAVHSGNVNMHATKYGSSTQRYKMPLRSSPPYLTYSPPLPLWHQAPKPRGPKCNRTDQFIRAQVRKQSLEWSNRHTWTIIPVVNWNHEGFQTNLHTTKIVVIQHNTSHVTIFHK